jgi:alanine racemase
VGEFKTMNNTHRTWVEIDLDNIANNIKEIKKHLNPGVRLMGVVKANAYGHGVRETAKIVLENGADALAVAFIDEAIELRRYGIKAPILILGNTCSESIEDLLNYSITPSVYSKEFACELSKLAVKMGKTAKIHIKTDTGMHRLGFLYGDDEKENLKTIEDIAYIYSLPNIEVEGIFSHLSTSDEEDADYTIKQFKKFNQLVEKLSQAGIKIPIRHIANSAATVKFPEMQLDMVRAGIVMYGMYPSDSAGYGGLKLLPAMKLKTRIINIKELKAGCDISYGRTYTTKANTKVATIAVGYADGYSRTLSGKVNVLVKGTLSKQLGRICMDQCMIDVTNVNNISIGDEVTLFGSDGNGNITIEEIADKMGTINYEVACLVGRRIPRIYIIDGKPTKSANYLLSD